MHNFERGYVNAHGYTFLIYKTRFGFTISFEGKWLWRSRSLADAKKVVKRVALNYMKDAL